MANAKEVKDLGALNSVSPEAAEGGPVLPSDAGEGPSDMPVPADAGEDPVRPLCRQPKVLRRWGRSRRSKGLQPRTRPRRWLSS
jgi:hypothetical protein